MKKLNWIALLSASVLATACASTPKEEPMTPVAEKPAMTAPQDVFEAPQTENVDRAPVVTDQGPIIVQGPTPGSSDDFITNVGDRVFFDYDRYDLTPQATNVLRAQAQWMAQYPSTIVVIGGHADERGTREYNLALGSRRAESVKDFLISQGVAPNRITTVSYGKERPIAPGSDEQSWALNRNAHTVLVSGTNS